VPRVTPGSSGRDLPAVVETLLLIAHVVVLQVRLEGGLRLVAQDLRADEDDEVFLVEVALRVLNNSPMIGMLPR
jgi:hypothetical protein